MAKDNDGEIVSFQHNEADLRDEVNRRTAKAGYTDSDGQRKERLADIVSMPATDKYRENYKRVFGHD